jgi:hypothetical protein
MAPHPPICQIISLLETWGGSFFWCKVEEDKQWMTTATASAVKVGIRRRYRVPGRVVGGGTRLGAARYYVSGIDMG